MRSIKEKVYSIKVKYFGITDKGILRKSNQDNYRIVRCEKQGCTVIALCDGMGGANAGDVASDIVTMTFTDYIVGKLTSRIKKELDYYTVLNDACDAANESAYDYSQFDDSLTGMGTTLVGGVIEDDGNVHIVNIGDSRAYLLDNHRIEQITTDHSLVEELVKSGSLTRSQAKTHPKKNIITRAVGTEPVVPADYYELKLKRHSSLMFCSDGLSNFVPDEEVLDFYRQDHIPENFCKNLLRCTYEKGAADNVTIVLVVNE